MGIQGLLREVAETYDAQAGTKRGVPGQRVLRGVSKRSDLRLPSGLFVKGYGGQSTAAATPWIGVFDPTVNSDPGNGLYLAYIFSADLRTVTLTLQQGITHLEERLGRGRARQDHLRRQATRLRRAVAAQRRIGWVDEPELRANVNRPKAYEAASVIARPYELIGLPDEVVLVNELAYAAELLKRTAVADDLWWFEDESSSLKVNLAPAGHIPDQDDPLAGFKPKDSSDYVANIPARQQLKKRSHEELVGAFGPHVASRGYIPITHLMHPRDLVLRRQGDAASPGSEWLVEAKVVRDGNPTEAVRQVVGQLYEYSHFLYAENKLSEPHLVALFTEDIGIYSQYLERRGIASVWREDQGWAGSAMAEEWNLLG